MEVATMDVSNLLADEQPLSEEQFSQLIKFVRGGARQRERFESDLRETAGKRASAWSRNAVMALKVGQAYYAIGDYTEALKWLDWAGSGLGQCYLKGCSLRAQGDYAAALKEFEQAEDKGYESFNISMVIVDCLRRQGDLEGAQERLKRASRVGEIRAEYHFQLGRLHDANGLREEAMAEYERAIALDGNHAEALFFLAFACDLYGQEEEAIEYYERCLKSEQVYVSALLNLAVLYEDAEDYQKAWHCVKRVLMVYPNHPRARLFLRDIESSMTMYYDEEQERRIDSRNKVLEIPVTDFELSVRSRNCLKKMNIRTLGDLLRVTESELLAYKNFGETSLQEIKIILNSKGLRLGQMLEDRNELAQEDIDSEDIDEQDEEVMSTPVSELNLSVRSRKCLQRLTLDTVEDLIKCTEAELLGCKNFGMTSLLEIKQSLKERELSLRQLDE